MVIFILLKPANNPLNFKLSFICFLPFALVISCAKNEEQREKEQLASGSITNGSSVLLGPPLVNLPTEIEFDNMLQKVAHSLALSQHVK